MKKSTNLSTGAVDNTVRDAIRTSYNLVAVPRLTVDWNYNRYTTPVATNTPSEDTDGYDIERFPVESIVEALRPSKGAPKAKINEAVVSAGYISADNPRFYVSDTEDVYKYWTAPYPTDSSGNFPLHSDGSTTARPRVTYDRIVKANKIVIKVENTWATPSAYQVRVSSTVGGAFSAVGGTNPAINGATGTLTLYYNGTAWVSAKPATLVTTNVTGIEFAVTSMGPGIKRNGAVMAYHVRGDQDTWYPTTGANSSLNVISIAAHMEADLTSRLINVSDTFDMADSSQLYPIGTITTNTASVTLSNEDGVFNPENTQSPYATLIEPNAEMRLEYIYTIGGVQHSVQQFKMYVSSWGNSSGTTSVELEDYSKYLKEIKPRPMLIENKSSTEIVWRILDSVGFVDYKIQDEDLVENTIIPVFWTDGEETVWEVLDALANATQTAIYFDEDGDVQVRTRKAAFKDAASADWNLLAEQQGTSLPDIISWSASGEYEANKIEVKYKTTKWKVNSQGNPAMTKVWEPDGDTVVVRSSQLIRPIDNTSNYIFLEQKEAKLWPFKSKVQIDGEIIQYDGKQFIYYTYTEGTAANGTPTYTAEVKNVVNITSNDDFLKYNRMTPQRYRHKNRYTGGLFITERAIWNSEKRNHTIDINGWSTKYELNGKGASPTQRSNVPGFNLQRKDSTVILNTPKEIKDTNDTYWALRGTSGSDSYKVYGTRFKFHKDDASTAQTAGISYQMSGTREAGYYVQIRTSRSLSASERKNYNEVSIYSRVNGNWNSIGTSTPVAIGEKIWYDVDVYHSGTGNNQAISVFLNGQKVAEASTNATTAQADSGRFGLFARGRTKVEFEYIYAVARDIVEPTDDYGFFDLKYGGIRGEAWQKEYVWEIHSRRHKIVKKNSTKEQHRHNEYIFDEFGPYVHEVREFDVKFDPAPVRSSYLFNTNEWFSAVPEYTGNPFGATFIVANMARFHAVLHGEDNLYYAGASAPVNQVCVVLGQNLEIADEETVTKKNESSIRSRGEITSELSSDWIQSESMAETLATWMAGHWSDSVDEATVEVFGNPVLELGDVVDVTYPRENMTPATHKYFVVGIETAFENGITTSLTLRRKREATDVS